jgi:hypothetical protein
MTGHGKAHRARFYGRQDASRIARGLSCPFAPDVSSQSQAEAEVPFEALPLAPKAINLWLFGTVQSQCFRLVR